MTTNSADNEAACDVIRTLCAGLPGDGSVTTQPRAWTVFAIKMQLPFPTDGLSLPFHTDGCGLTEDGLACTPQTCRAVLVFFKAQLAERVELASVFDGLDQTTEWLLGEGYSAAPNFDVVPWSNWFVAVGLPEFVEGEQYEGLSAEDVLFDLLGPFLQSIAFTTGVHIPPVVPTNLWPFYSVARQSEDGSIDSPMLHVVEDESIASAEPVDLSLLLRAAHTLPWRNEDPSVNVLELVQSAASDVSVTGDYLGGAIKAAAAAELLLKHFAFMTEWEIDRKSLSRNRLKMTAADIVGKLLHQRFGDWDHGQPGVAQEWVVKTKDLRNEVLHTGRRVTREEAVRSINALVGVLQRVSHDAAAHRAERPWTALNFATQVLMENGEVEAVQAEVMRRAGVEDLDEAMWLYLREYLTAIK